MATIEVPTRQQSTLDYQALAAEVRADGGFTVALDGNRPTTGYVVGLPGCERRIPARAFDGWAIYRYVIDHGRLLRTADHYIGAQVDRGTVYLDVSEVLQDRESAMALAEQRRQLAVFDLAAGAEITTTGATV
ncbi:MAG: hypothetical protein ACXVHB_06020 [Solirubrobacteraceae bacterium]